MSTHIPPYYEEFKKYLRATCPLSDEAIGMISGHVSFQEVEKGEIVQQSGEVCHTIYMVRKGIFRNYMIDESQEITRWFAVEGDVFTSMLSFWKGVPTQATVEAVTKGEVWSLNMQLAQEVLHKSGEWRDWLLRMLIEGIALVENRDHMFISTDAYTRYRNLSNYRTPDFLNQVPLSVLASYLRVTPRTLSRCRNKYFKEELRKK